MTSTPRVRHVASVKDLSSRLPTELKKKWAKRADRDYQSVYEIYMRIAEKCLWWRHIIKYCPDKKKKNTARKRFLTLYPEMMALNQIGLDDHLPFSTPMKLDHLYFKLNKR